MIRKRTKEIHRLIEAFEKEANQFYDIEFSVFYLSQNGPVEDRKFHEKNHTIMLWQYQGNMDEKNVSERVTKNVMESNLQWGLKGAQYTCCGVIEGPETDLFVKMAKRSANLFDKNEIRKIQNAITAKLRQKLKENGVERTIMAFNRNPLGIWMSYLLYHLSMVQEDFQPINRIDPEPFCLSLLALEKLLEDKKPSKSDRSSKRLEDIKFKVALSFPGEKRRYVSNVVKQLKKTLGSDSVFYDYDYQSQLARPNLDVFLQKIYREQSELIVVFLCKEYSEKEWCGLEFRAVRDMIKSKNSDKVMFVKFDDSQIDGLFSVDGYISAEQHSSNEIADFVLQRIELNS